MKNFPDSFMARIFRYTGGHRRSFDGPTRHTRGSIIEATEGETIVFFGRGRMKSESKTPESSLESVREMDGVSDEVKTAEIVIDQGSFS